MPRPRRLGSSPNLNRSLSRLSSSSSFSSRQSNSRIYVFLIAGGLFLLVTVAFLQVHLLRAPHGSKLSPLENGISDDEQARWKDKAGDLDKPRAVEKGKLGRKMGAFEAFQGDIEDAESGDEDMDAGEEMGDDGDDEEDDRFDVDIDDRVLEDESEDLEDMNLGVLAEMSNEDTAESILNETKPVHMVAENTVPSVVVEEAASVESKGSDEAMEKPVRKSSSIPDWVLDTQQKGADSEGDIQKNVEKSKGSFFWDHALGVRKKPLEENDSAVVESAAKVAVLQLRGFKEVVQNWKERFNSDDELLDDNVQQRLEGVREIEDALLLNGDGQSSSKKSSKKGRAATFDPMNPVNNPMLQDPDTSPGTWMTKSDKQILRAMRGGDHLSSSGQQLLRGKVPTAVTIFDRQASTVKASSEEKEDISKILPADEKQGKEADSLRSNSSGKPLESSLQWGQYPGINSSLSFSDFITTFLGQESCTMNVFLVWTTHSWGFTARHHRVLESLFRFHRHACVVVFSETFDFDFFKSYSKEGYKVAVMRPNLAKLLADTACDVFNAVLPVWKGKPLFHLHYTELLRLAALYKFGGIYMDMDMIVLRPLDTLHNTVGSEIMASGELRLNGAILIFDKSSLFLKKCMDEFKSTYDETLVEWNGAELLTRVANSTVDDKGSTWRQFPSLLKIQGPFTFFPLDSSRISKFFDAPGDDTQKQHQAELMTRLSEEAYTVHLWSSITANKVPDITSLVGTILSRSCLRCKESLL